VFTAFTQRLGPRVTPEARQCAKTSPARLLNDGICRMDTSVTDEQTDEHVAITYAVLWIYIAYASRGKNDVSLLW